MVKGVAVAALLAAAMPAAAQRGSLQDDVRALIDRRKLGPSRIGLVLLDVQSRTVLAEIRPDEQFIPASNMKLLTSAAAMMVLGPDFSFRTELVLSDGRLVVRGDGDPALGDPEVLRLADAKITVDDVLRTLATNVSRAGVTSVDEVVVDDRVFDRVALHPSWNPENFHQPFSAQVAGVNFHANVLSVFVRPNPAGENSPPFFETQPAAAWMRIDASKTRTNPKGNNTVWLVRQGTANDFEMRGEVARPSRAPVMVTVSNPSLWFGQLLATSLEKQSVRVGPTAGAGVAPTGSNLRPAAVRLAQDQEQFGEGRVVAAVTTPIIDVLHRCNEDSENLYAEALLKRMGKKITGEPGSWTNGAAVLRMLLSQEVGPSAAASTMVSDGSGLSRDNRVTPATMAQWLATMATKPWAKEFIDSLAQPGEGTLENRFRNAKLTGVVSAKSGYIRGVRSLSGYVQGKDGEGTLVFAIFLNDVPAGDAHNEARALHEDIVLLLDRTIARRAARRNVAGAER